MPLWHKRSTPIDRAVEDLDRQIAALQKQLRQVSAESLADGNTPHPVGASPAPGPVSRAEAAMKFMKDFLTPPEKRPFAAHSRVRQDLFDVPTEPLKDLEAEPIAFSRRTDSDLFMRAGTGATAPTPTRRVGEGQIDCMTKPDEKLAHYLSAGSIKTYKPLKHVQRQTRNRFFMWLGLSLVALWILYAVIR